MFWNDYGKVEMTRPFPKRMTWQKALEFSIKKWEFILEELLEGREINNPNDAACALCVNAYRKTDSWCIKTCPVRRKTKRGFCGGTPFGKVDYVYPNTIEAEIKFLKSLRK